MKEDSRKLKVLFYNEDKELLSTVLKYLDVFLDYAEYKKVIFLLPRGFDFVKTYEKKHSFFAYRVVDVPYLKRQMKRRVIFPKKDFFIMNPGNSYGNNLLELVGRNGFTIDDAVLIGMYHMPETWLKEQGLI